jgi:hypothetical protein
MQHNTTAPAVVAVVCDMTDYVSTLSSTAELVTSVSGLYGCASSVQHTTCDDSDNLKELIT